MPNQIIRPNANGQNTEWTAEGAATHYLCVNKIVTQPAIPSLLSDIYVMGQQNYEEFQLETIETMNTATQIDVWIYGRLQGEDQGDNISVDLYDITTLHNTQMAKLPIIAGWVHLTIIGLTLTKTQIDDLRIRIVGSNYDAELFIYAAYLDVTYTVQSNIEPLPKRQPQMSGYNYFVKDYIKQKNKSEPCRKLPDGTIF